TFVDQGDEGTVTLKLDQKVPFEGKAKMALLSLPTGVTAEPVEIPKEDKEVKFTIKASGEAQVGQHQQLIAQFTLEKDGEPMVNTIASGGILRVDRASVSKNYLASASASARRALTSFSRERPGNRDRLYRAVESQQ